MALCLRRFEENLFIIHCFFISFPVSICIAGYGGRVYNVQTAYSRVISASGCLSWPSVPLCTVKPQSARSINSSSLRGRRPHLPRRTGIVPVCPLGTLPLSNLPSFPPLPLETSWTDGDPASASLYLRWSPWCWPVNCDFWVSLLNSQLWLVSLSSVLTVFQDLLKFTNFRMLTAKICFRKINRS